jgi:hypothetical protein
LARVAGLSAVAAVLAVVACESRVPTQAEVASMDAASAERGAARYQIVADGVAPVFMVDGVQMPAEKAKAIPAELIATVNVSKGAGTQPSVIAITTKAGVATDGERRVKISGVMPPGEAKVVADRDAWKPLPSKEPFHGLVLIDGVKATLAQMTALAPSDIESVNILKGDAAKSESTDPAAAFGIIRITTKKHGAR